MNTKELVCLAARLADGKKAEDIRVIDLEEKSSLCDFILLATATSTPHLEAIEEEISTKLKEQGIYKINRDGRESQLWRVSDYGGFLVHIMLPQARSFYALEELFDFGKVIDFTKPVKKAVKKSTVKKTTAKKSATKTATKKVTVKKTVARKTATKKSAKKTTKNK